MTRGVFKYLSNNYGFCFVLETQRNPGSMDMRDVDLTNRQREAMRVLHYDNSVKVSIAFKRRWSQTGDFVWSGYHWRTVVV
jgi:hypothetical protein